LSGTPKLHSNLARSVLSDTAIGSLAYKVTFTGPGGTVIEREVEGGSISITLDAGAWVIGAEAFTLEEDDMSVLVPVLVGTGTATVTVVPGQYQSVTIPMTVDPAYEANLTEIYIHNETELRRIGTDFAIDGSIQFYLERDIVLTQPWTAIGSGSAPFKAQFDGQGHSVTVTSFGPAIKETGDVWVYQGFFAAAENAAIKNIHVKYDLSGPVDIRTGDGSTYHDACAGGVAGKAYNNTVFENIRVSGDFSVIFDGMSSLSAGGITGSSDSGTIANCHVSGAIGGDMPDGALWLGGIAGNSMGGDINGSSFTGAVEGTAPGENCWFGGIAGDMDGDITASYVSARVQGQGGSVYAGGVAGRLFNGSIDRCYAWANVSADGTYEVSVGGIAGQNDAVITKCYARGSVLGENASGGYQGAGGIAGRITGTGEYCAALNDSVTYPLYAHGIAGGDTTATYTNNYAAADITFTSPWTNTTNLDGDRTYYRVDFMGQGNQGKYTALGWNFTNDWKWLSGYSYPALSWQTTPPLDPATL
jgi:hypothetical protein